MTVALLLTASLLLSILLMAVLPSRRSPPADSLTELEIWNWYQRLAAFVTGLSLGSFFFGFVLSGLLLSSHRPDHPDFALGYTYLFKIKSDEIYGNYFEMLVASPLWPLGSWICGVIGVGFAYAQGIKFSSNNRLQILAGVVASLVLNFAVWRAFTYLFRP
jgi:hypothetical protein